MPAAARFDTLRSAVSFTREELRRLLGKVGIYPDALDPVVLEQGSVKVGTIGVEDNPLYTRPLVRDGDGYTVAVPRLLLTALCNALSRLAKYHGVEAHLARNYAELVFLNVERSLAFLGNDLLGGRTPEENTNSFYEVAFSLDRDKVINVVLATDHLSRYDANNLSSGWIDQGLSDRLQARLKEAEAKIMDCSGAPNEVLHLGRV